jgi:hypothetical protein
MEVDNLASALSNVTKMATSIQDELATLGADELPA